MERLHRGLVFVLPRLRWAVKVRNFCFRLQSKLEVRRFLGGWSRLDLPSAAAVADSEPWSRVAGAWGGSPTDGSAAFAFSTAVLLKAMRRWSSSRPGVGGDCFWQPPATAGGGGVHRRVVAEVLGILMYFLLFLGAFLQVLCWNSYSVSYLGVSVFVLDFVLFT